MKCRIRRCDLPAAILGMDHVTKVLVGEGGLRHNVRPIDVPQCLLLQLEFFNFALAVISRAHGLAGCHLLCRHDRSRLLLHFFIGLFVRRTSQVFRL